jgi:hypothetical protein
MAQQRKSFSVVGVIAAAIGAVLGSYAVNRGFSNWTADARSSFMLMDCPVQAEQGALRTEWSESLRCAIDVSQKTASTRASHTPFSRLRPSPRPAPS